jgi:hypothetical protein
MDAEGLRSAVFSRRSALKAGAATAFLLSQAALLEHLAHPVARAEPSSTTFPDIQFDLGAFIKPAEVLNDGAGIVTLQFPPVYTLFQPVQLTRTPTPSDQATLDQALRTIEGSFPASPSGVLIFSVSYGLPYFSRLPSALVATNIPTTLADPSRPVLVEAVPFATDVVGGLVGGPGALIPNVTKDRFNVDVVIESNDLLFEFRSDSLANLSAVTLWLQGSNDLNGNPVPSPEFSGLLSFQTPRIQFMQVGLPRAMAENAGFEFAGRINPDSSMAMGFVDQQVNASGPAQVVTFVGNSSSKMSNAMPGDYFDNGSIAHFSHDILDLYQFYNLPGQDSRRPDGEPFTERCQYMFRSNQIGTPNGIPATGNSDQFANGGGPAYINNVFQGTGSAAAEARDSAGTFTAANTSENATFTGEGRVGHIDALQRVSRAADTTPLHVRNDGPGLDSMDVPAFRTFPAASSSSCSSWCSCPPPTSSPRCARPRRRRTCSTSSLTTTTMTRAWNGSSPRRGGRTSWCPRAGTGPSRSWNSPILTPGRGQPPLAPALRRRVPRQLPRRAPARPHPEGATAAAAGEEAMAPGAAAGVAAATEAATVAVAATVAGSVQAR